MAIIDKPTYQLLGIFESETHYWTGEVFSTNESDAILITPGEGHKLCAKLNAAKRLHEDWDATYLLRIPYHEH